MAKKRVREVDVDRVSAKNRENEEYARLFDHGDTTEEYNEAVLTPDPNEPLYCMVDQTRCDGLCRKKYTNAAGTVCCPEVRRKSERNYTL